MRISTFFFDDSEMEKYGTYVVVVVFVVVFIFIILLAVFGCSDR